MSGVKVESVVVDAPSVKAAWRRAERRLTQLMRADPLWVHMSDCSPLFDRLSTAVVSIVYTYGADTERAGRMCEDAGDWENAFCFYQHTYPPTSWTDCKLGYCYAVGMHAVHIDVGQAFVFLQRAEAAGSVEASSLLNELHDELRDGCPPMRLQSPLRELAARRPRRPDSELDADAIHWVLRVPYNRWTRAPESCGGNDGKIVFAMPPGTDSDVRYLEVRRRADAGCARAQRALGMLLRCYRPGESRLWLDQAANAGHAWAQLDIWKNEGDDDKKYDRVLCSARQGWLCAMTRLSEWHRNEHLIGQQSRDLAASRKWLRLLSAAGSEDARQRYERFTYDGVYANLPNDPDEPDVTATIVCAPPH